MERYQIVEIAGGDNNAGTKATADIAAIADGLGFRRVGIRMDSTWESRLAKLQRQAGYFRDWRRAFAQIPAGAAVLLQHPFHHRQLTRERTLFRLKAEKGARFIAVVHDVEEIRKTRYSDYYAREFEAMLRLADALIVHNDVMRQWFVERGVPAERLISLEIFDYLQAEGDRPLPAFERAVTIAGNLDTKKSAYIARLGDVKGVDIHLYGSNYDAALEACGHIRYHGSLSPDALPARLNAGFGLVWDGESIDGCRGGTGQYLRYNNPHKLSLYLSSGLPVVIWGEAAEAALVRRADVGLCVDGLRALGDALAALTEADYRRMAENAGRLGRQLRAGAYGRRAIEAALGALERGAAHAGG